MPLSSLDIPRSVQLNLISGHDEPWTGGVLPHCSVGPIKSDFTVDNYCATGGLGVVYCQAAAAVLWTNHLRLGLFSAGQRQRLNRDTQWERGLIWRAFLETSFAARCQRDSSDEKQHFDLIRSTSKELIVKTTEN